MNYEAKALVQTEWLNDDHFTFGYNKEIARMY